MESLKIVIPSSNEPCQRSPELAPALHQYFSKRFGTPEKKAPEEISKRMEAAILRKRSLIQATIDRSSRHNKRAHAVAFQVKEQAAAAAQHRAALIRSRLDAAAERRRVHSSPASPNANQEKHEEKEVSVDAPSKEEGPLPTTEMAELSLTSDEALAMPTAASVQQEANEGGTQNDSLDVSEELEAQLATAANSDFVNLTLWMKDPATIGLVAKWLGRLGIERQLAKRMLAIVYMAHDTESLFDDSEPDKLMACEAARFMNKLRQQLKRGTKKALKEPFDVSFTRARRFYAAWARQDVPKQARVVDETVQRLHNALMRVRTQQVHDGEEAAPPEDILAQIRVLAGREAEQTARRCFERPWQPISREGLEDRVREVANRAMWDALKAKVHLGNYDGLFGVLGELQHAMGALVAHSARHADDLTDHFDAKWIEQQANAGCLTTDTVHQLMEYLVTRISEWQAPADDAETSAWTASVLATIAATTSMPLGEFIARHLVDFVEGCMKRVRKVHQRVRELADQMDGLRQVAGRTEMN
eukprot:CAMPEP_0119301620 /NCGR_PEP_ID=MMETSP1333-20130426/3370_1 /TAXON_ID=418940 /ORGANISM="Scyphosphaera apsteinii, Strain RCC1455" /LENGTH=531 /DNA_ID=CAMNT_0007303743 /DNA_START=47 /DNA_END=1642 /DNA_ORIENTATION=+